MTPKDETEQILTDAVDLHQQGLEYPETLSVNVLNEGNIAWISEGQWVGERDPERTVRAILVQCLAAMMLDGYDIVKRS